jgi:hypothetical protein
LLAFADGLFANANRFVRACMSFEAVLRDARELPEREALAAFATRIATSLDALAVALREGSTLPRMDDLRSEERAFAARLDAAVGEREAGIAAEVVEAFDRMTDSIDTLAHLILQADADLRRRT